VAYVVVCNRVGADGFSPVNAAAMAMARPVAAGFTLSDRLAGLAASEHRHQRPQLCGLPVNSSIVDVSDVVIVSSQNGSFRQTGLSICWRSSGQCLRRLVDSGVCAVISTVTLHRRVVVPSISGWRVNAGGAMPPGTTLRKPLGGFAVLRHHPAVRGFWNPSDISKRPGGSVG
jgi:hypothetical protein